MKFFSVVASVAFSTPAVHGAWCQSRGLSTGWACATGRHQFCCDAPSGAALGYNIFRGDCTRPQGDVANCGDGGYISCLNGLS